MLLYHPLLELFTNLPILFNVADVTFNSLPKLNPVKSFTGTLVERLFILPTNHYSMILI